MKRFFLNCMTATVFGLGALLGAGQACAGEEVPQESPKQPAKAPEEPNVSGQVPVITDPVELLERLHWIAQYDLRASELAKSRAQSEEVRELAQDVIEDQLTLVAEIQDCARKLGIELVQPARAGARPDATPSFRTARSSDPDFRPAGSAVPTYRSSEKTVRSTDSTTVRSTDSTVRSSEKVVVDPDGSRTVVHSESATTSVSGEADKRQVAVDRLNRLSTLSGPEFDLEYARIMSTCATGAQTFCEQNELFYDAKGDDRSGEIEDLLESAIDKADDHKDAANDVIEELNE